ncbi:putative quinol monooxygenase [Parasphingopyxis sp.]|uniref:putative quinol monooxygenase n=1 Tax=Parasphingopyxis sp. TaxID=1920299 RepID=UPI003FA021E5
MNSSRREVIKLTGALAAAVALGAPVRAQEGSTMYGLIGQLIAQPGKRGDLIAILSAATGDMPGNLAYVIAEDHENEDAIWVTEIWDSAESHAASLGLPAIQQAMAEGRPLIAGMGHRFETTPVAGV